MKLRDDIDEQLDRKLTDSLKEQFINPADEFTPIPFWFWNEELEEEELKRQLIDFKSKGVNGFVIHPRIGIPECIEYMSPRFLDLVEFVTKEAASQNMRIVLYDEAMYPSGSAHGMVVKDDPGYASRGLKMIEYPVKEGRDIYVKPTRDERVVSVLAVEKKCGDSYTPKYVHKCSILNSRVIIPSLFFETTDPKERAVLVFMECFSGGTIRGIHFGEDDGEPNAPLSADLLNPAAVRKFIRLTHEKYFQRLSLYFGSTIIAMFTDEPDILGRNHLPDLIPWTEDFLTCYQDNGNSELDLPALWLDGGAETEKIRSSYQSVVIKKMETAYYKPIAQWCENHQIALTGHPQKSDQIGLLDYFHIPGQDLVWRWVAPENGLALEGEHSTQGKCSSDAARHSGKRRNSNECFGCCGPNGEHWAFSMDDMKWYLDWLFVRGVNLIYPHAFFYSIDGEKRFGERPPDVGPNNIWWKHYSSISSYIKRMSWLMTDVVNQTEIAVLCREDHLPWRVPEVLFQNQIEFNYLEERLLLSEQCRMEHSYIRLHSQQYKILIVEDFSLLSPKILDLLRSFCGNGGIVTGLNGGNRLSEKNPFRIMRNCEQIADLLKKSAEIKTSFFPLNKDLRICHVTKQENHFILLVNEGEEEIRGTLAAGVFGAAEYWDPWTGEIRPLASSESSESELHYPVKLERRSSGIIRIDPDQEPLYLSENDFVETCKNVFPLQQYPLPDGNLLYKDSFELSDNDAADRIILDMGEVYEIAEVEVNGNHVGVKMWKPYILDITDNIKVGENTITIKTAASRINELMGTDYPYGLKGPVRLLVCYK